MKRKVMCLLLAALLLCPIGVYAREAPEDLHLIAMVYHDTVNQDVVGYLVLPGTDVDGPVVQGPEDDYNRYYLRRNYQGEYDMQGCLMTDCRGKFGAELSVNTVIYGNNMSLDGDPDAPMFSQLLRYRDAEFCAKNPVVYFGDTTRTMAWEIFAVGVSTIQVPYNDPAGGDAWWQGVEQIRRDSLHDFSHISVTREDKILTLSTADYSTVDVYPNDYRFVVLAKQVELQPAGAPPESSPAGLGVPQPGEPVSGGESAFQPNTGLPISVQEEAR